MLSSLLVIKNFWKLKQNLKSYKIKTKTKVTEFCDKQIPKLDSNHTYLTVISLDSIFNKDRNFCPQLFLKETHWKKVSRHIIEKLESSSDDSDQE